MMHPAVRLDYREGKNTLCCRLAMLGFSADLISQKTGLSVAQIYYRLRQSGIHIWDYRNGRGRIASFVIERTEELTTKELAAKLRPLLLKRGNK